MTDAKELSAVFRLVSDFFKTLQEEQVEELLSKQAKLAVISPGAVVAKPGLEATGLALVTGILKKLPPEQVEQLVSKQGQLAFLPPGATITLPAFTNKDIEARLAVFTARDQALQYLVGLKLTQAPLKSLAKDLNVALDKQDRVADIRAKIVEATVGTRVDAALIRGGGWTSRQRD